MSGNREYFTRALLIAALLLCALSGAANLHAQPLTDTPLTRRLEREIIGLLANYDQPARDELLPVILGPMIDRQQRDSALMLMRALNASTGLYERFTPRRAMISPPVRSARVDTAPLPGPSIRKYPEANSPEWETFTPALSDTNTWSLYERVPLQFRTRFLYETILTHLHAGRTKIPKSIVDELARRGDTRLAVQLITDLFPELGIYHSREGDLARDTATTADILTHTFRTANAGRDMELQFRVLEKMRYPLAMRLASDLMQSDPARARRILLRSAPFMAIEALHRQQWDSAVTFLPMFSNQFASMIASEIAPGLSLAGRREDALRLVDRYVTPADQERALFGFPLSAEMAYDTVRVQEYIRRTLLPADLRMVYSRSAAHSMMSYGVRTGMLRELLAWAEAQPAASRAYAMALLLAVLQHWSGAPSS